MTRYILTKQPPIDKITVLDEPLKSLLSPIRQFMTKIEWLDWEENFVADHTADVLDGSLTIDAAGQIRRNFSMTVSNSSGLYVPNGACTSMGVKVRIKRGLLMANGGSVWWNRGVFALSDPSSVHSGADKTVEISGLDKWALLDGSLGGTLTNTTVIPKGTNIAEAIRAVAEDAGETKFAFDVCTVVTPYTVTKEPGESRADLIEELALIPSWDIYYDADGYLRFTSLIDPLQKQVVADLSAQGEYRKCYVSSEYNPEWSRIKNYWKVIGYSDPDTGIIYDGVAQNNNLQSPTNTAVPPAGIGIKADVLTDDNLTTDSLCEQRAGYELRKNLTRIDRSRHEILPLPFLNEGDCLQLEDPVAGIVLDKYEIQSINEPFGLGLMQLECWRCSSVSEMVAYDDFQLGMGSWQQLGLGEIDIVGIDGNNCLRKKTHDSPNGGYRLLDKKAVDFEMVVYTRRDSMSEDGNEYAIVDASGNGYGVGLYYSGIMALGKCEDWELTGIDGSLIDVDLNEWYTLRLIKMSSNLTLEIYAGKDDAFTSPLMVFNAFDSSYTTFDRVIIMGGYDYYSDDVTVRKLL